MNLRNIRVQLTLLFGVMAAVAVASIAWFAINQGRESAQRAVLDGRITIGGDPQVLVDHAEALAATNERVGEIRATTVYD